MCHSSTFTSGQQDFLFVEIKGCCAIVKVWLPPADCCLNGSSVDFHPCLFYIVDIAVYQEFLNLVQEAVLQLVMDLFWTLLSCEFWEWNMFRLKRDHPEVLVYIECFGLGEELFKRRHLDVSSCDAESWFLNSLKLSDWCVFGNGKPYICCVGEYRANETFDVNQYSLLLLAPVSTTRARAEIWRQIGMIREEKTGIWWIIRGLMGKHWRDNIDLGVFGLLPNFMCEHLRFLVMFYVISHQPISLRTASKPV